jgi:hypothetical protein
MDEITFRVRIKETFKMFYEKFDLTILNKGTQKEVQKFVRN